MAIHCPEPLHHQPADATDYPASVTASETVLSLPMAQTYRQVTSSA